MPEKNHSNVDLRPTVSSRNTGFNQSFMASGPIATNVDAWLQGRVQNPNNKQFSQNPATCSLKTWQKKKDQRRDTRGRARANPELGWIERAGARNRHCNAPQSATRSPRAICLQLIWQKHQTGRLRLAVSRSIRKQVGARIKR